MTADDKEAFLALIRVGHDSATAARKVSPEYTSTMFRRLMNESNPNYDPEFTSAFLRATAEGHDARNEERQRQPSGAPRKTTLSGHVKAAYLTEEMLEPFLDNVSNGMPLAEAAQQIEPKTSLSQINRRVNRDPEFAERYAEAKEVGYPIFVENLRNEAIRQGQNGDYRALRDLLLIHVPEYRQLMTSRHEITGPDGGALRLLAEQALPQLPAEMLETLIEHMEKKQIEAARPPDIDAEAA